jgi:hypothetical protein
MDGLFLLMLVAIIVDQSWARVSIRRTGSRGSSLPRSSLIPSIVVPIMFVILVTIVIVIICLKKRANRARMGVHPLGPRIQLPEPHTTPVYYHAPPYAQPPAYEQYPPGKFYQDPTNIN